MTQTPDTERKWTPYPSPSDPVLFDSRGARRTASLFLETTTDLTYPPVLTLRDFEKNGLPSAYNMYMNSDTEYDAAIKMVGCMTHWRMLMTKKWFMDGDPERHFSGLTQWRLDMQARDATQAMSVIKDAVANGDKQAAQFLLNYATKGEFAGKSKLIVKQRTRAQEKKNEKNRQKAAVTDLQKVMKQLKAVPKGE